MSMYSLQSLIFLKKGKNAYKNSYIAGNLHKAIADVQAGEALNMRAAAHKCGIPPSTLHDHLYKGDI